MNKEKWYLLQEYVAEKLKEIDPYARSTKGSGNCGEQGDVNNSVGLTIECKLRNTQSVQINNEIWEKLCEEIPLHSDRLPLLVLENQKGKRWGVMELDDLINIYIDAYNYRNPSPNVNIIKEI